MQQGSYSPRNQQQHSIPKNSPPIERNSPPYPPQQIPRYPEQHVLPYPDQNMASNHYRNVSPHKVKNALPYPNNDLPPSPVQDIPMDQPQYAYDNNHAPRINSVEDPGNPNETRLLIRDNQEELLAYYILKFENPLTRKLFISKVFAIVSVMLGIVATMVTCSYLPTVRNFLENEENNKLIIVSFIAALLAWIIILIMLTCIQCVRKSFPCNFVLLGLNALAIGVIITISTAYIKPFIVVVATLNTFVIVLVIALVARFSKIDVTGIGFIWKFTLFALVITVISSVILFFFGGISLVHNIITAILILITVIYLLIDLQLIMGGKRNAISPEEGVYASIILFTDIINLFLLILSLYK
uniref:Inhibitor of apoptosis-promoting Bax1-domain-containing protein n=1 Tax=Parastrongyloides trichosuri TaxID=131310 RepID=A0A0N4ZF16_PARTI